MSDTGSTEPMASRPGDAAAGRPVEPMATRPAATPGTTATRAGDDLRVERTSDEDDHRLGGTSRQRRDRTDPVEAAKDPDTRAKLLLATAALTLLNTILLIAILASVLGGPGEEVVVDGVPCIVADAGEEQTLYCQR